MIYLYLNYFTLKMYDMNMKLTNIYYNHHSISISCTQQDYGSRLKKQNASMN